jgi:hypothetical protein
VLTRVLRLHQDDAKDAQWFDVDSLPELAFDHKLVVRRSLHHLAAQPDAKQTGKPPLVAEIVLNPSSGRSIAHSKGVQCVVS